MVVITQIRASVILSENKQYVLEVMEAEPVVDASGALCGFKELGWKGVCEKTFETWVDKHNSELDE